MWQDQENHDFCMCIGHFPITMTETKPSTSTWHGGEFRVRL